MATFTCDFCKNSFQRRPAAVRPGHKKYCNVLCQGQAENWSSQNTTGTYTCPLCKEELSSDKFDWYRRNGRPKRFSYCQTCRPKKRAHHYKAAAANYRKKWEAKRRAVSKDSALSWYFARNLTQYRSRSRQRDLPECDLTADYLVELFHLQEGRCYYTGEPLVWDTYGSIVARKDSMSVDRLTPELGYCKGNVVVCGYTTNTSKGTRSEAEFYSFCEQVLKFRDQRQAATTNNR